MTTPNEDSSQARFIDLEVEVPGTPEQVWEAIATGPGISAWMHPTEVGEGEGGRFAFDMGSGMNESGVVTAWDPPRRFATRGVEWKPSEQAPAAELATVWLVEARDGGSCVVRMVISGFGTGADWDAEIEGMGDGMRMSLDNLRLYLTHFLGQSGSWIRAFGNVAGTREQAWAALAGALGLSEAAEGARAAVSGPDLPAFSGVVERDYDGTAGRDVLLRIDEPAPGLASVALFGGGAALVQVCLYGDEAASIAAGHEPRWQAWMDANFPTDESTS